MSAASARTRFREAYGAHRASEGRTQAGDAVLELPYLTSGPPMLVRQWAVRARTWETFHRRVLAPRISRQRHPVRLLDLGAGNGWLSLRAAHAGCEPLALDLRDDRVDGLGAMPAGLVERLAASFEELPLADRRFDVVVFNASLHYATDLAAVLAEACRVTRRGGTVAVLDSPFYRRERDGAAMVAEKHATARERFGERAAPLLALPFVEFLTAERLARASAPLRLHWRRHRVRYPLWYELRPARALLRGQRIPSRFDCWECTVR